MSSSGGSKYFNPIPLFILFREAIEASIVVAVLLTFLSRASPSLKKHVWWGVAGGVGISLLLAGVFAVLFYVAQNNVFTGPNLLIFKGVVGWVACVFITYLAFAMLRFEGWEAKWERKLAAQGIQKILDEDAKKRAAEKENALEEGNREPRDSEEQPSTSSAEDAKPHVTTSLSDANNELAAALADTPAPAKPRGLVSRMRHACAQFFSHYSLFFVVFFTVLREGMEASIFLFGVGNADPVSIPISGLIGVACGVMVGVVLYYTGRSVKDIKWLLFSFAAVLFFIAAGSSELGAESLMYAGMFGPYVLPQTAYQAPGVGAVSGALYGVEGRPPAPAAGAAATSAFNDGDEIVATGPVNLNDGYVYIMTPRQPWWQEPVWDISACCGDTDDKNKFFALIKPIFGYNAKPTFIDCIFYMGYWFVVLSIGLWKWYNGTLLDADWKHTKMMRTLRRKQMEEEAAMRAKMGDAWCPSEVSSGTARDTAAEPLPAVILGTEAVTIDTTAATPNPLVAAARP